jgi:hypothetical protein
VTVVVVVAGVMSGALPAASTAFAARPRSASFAAHGQDGELRCADDVVCDAAKEELNQWSATKCSHYNPVDTLVASILIDFS